MIHSDISLLAQSAAEAALCTSAFLDDTYNNTLLRNLMQLFISESNQTVQELGHQITTDLNSVTFEVGTRTNELYFIKNDATASFKRNEKSWLITLSFNELMHKMQYLARMLDAGYAKKLVTYESEKNRTHSRHLIYMLGVLCSVYDVEEG